MLIGPVAATIDAEPRLVIVPDPVLQELPFGLLLRRADRSVYADHALVFSPSATAYTRLARLRRAGET